MMKEKLDPAAHGLIRGDIVFLSDTTKLTLLDSLLQEVTAGDKRKQLV